MITKNATIAIGCGGWDHADFDDCFYPDHRLASLDKLAYYSRFFDTVEIRSTFWDDTLTASDALDWVGAVTANKHFTFNVKLHSRFTHRRELSPSLARSVRELLQTLDSRNRLGALLVQFPFSFTNTSAHRFHLTKLGEIFRGFPVHVELRHSSWDQPSLTSFLEENLLHPVSADLPKVKQYMPFLTGIVGKHAYLRLHGRNEKGWLLNSMDARYDYQYNEREIREIVRRVHVLEGKCDRITIICNNTTQGKALISAFQLAAAVRETRTVLMPHATLEHFPVLTPLAAADGALDVLLSAGRYREAV